MSADSSTKTVKITTGAAESLSPSNYEEGAEPEKKGGRTRKNNRRINVQKEGGAMSPGTLDQLVSSRAPGTTDSSQDIKSGVSSKMTEEAAPVGKVAPSIIGGSPEPKIHLTKTQKKAKVVLAPSVKKTRAETKKKAVKMLKMNLSGLTRRLKKASGIHKSAKEKTIADIKQTLIKMELVSKDTKAPDAVLRQIYSDVETMKKRAL